MKTLATRTALWRKNHYDFFFIMTIHQYTDVHCVFNYREQSQKKTGRLSESPPAEINNAFNRLLINNSKLLNYVEFKRL